MKSNLIVVALLFAMVWSGCPVSPDATDKISETPAPCTGASVLGGECTRQCPPSCSGCGCNGYFLGCACQCLGCDEPPVVGLAPDEQLDAVRRILEESQARVAPALIEQLEAIRRGVAAGDPDMEKVLLAFDQDMMLLDATTLERLMALVPGE